MSKRANLEIPRPLNPLILVECCFRNRWGVDAFISWRVDALKSWILVEGGGFLFLLSLHPLVIIPTFLFSLYFIKGGRFITGGFMYIYTMYKGRKTETEKCVCTRVADRVLTLGGISSDTLLQVVLTDNGGCAHGQGKMWLKKGEIHKYTVGCIFMQNRLCENRVYGRGFSFGRK